MKKIKIKKTHILIAAYIILIVTELFFCVPYHRIQIFRTKQNVPHTEIIGSGYTTMAEIENSYTYISGKYTSDVGKRVNTPQMFMNVSITTALAVAIYFLMKKNDEVKELPILDVNSLAFADDDTIEQAQIDYAKKMAEYVKKERMIYKNE